MVNLKVCYLLWHEFIFLDPFFGNSAETTKNFCTGKVNLSSNLKLNPLQPNTNILNLHIVSPYISLDGNKENLFNSQEFLYLVIISFTMCNLGVLL